MFCHILKSLSIFVYICTHTICVCFMSHWKTVSCGMQNSPSGHCAYSGLLSQLRAPKLRKPQSNGPRANMPNLRSLWQCYLCYSGRQTNVSSVSEWTLSLSSKDVCYTNLLEKIVQDKSYQCLPL